MFVVAIEEVDCFQSDVFTHDARNVICGRVCTNVQTFKHTDRQTDMADVSMWVSPHYMYRYT